MDKNKTDHEVVLRTGKIHEFDMAKSILSKREIPFIAQQEGVSGLKVAAPVTSAPAPGQWWSILVPIIAVHDAKIALSELPFEIETNPDIWHIGTAEKAKKAWRIYVWIVLAVFCLFLVLCIINLLD